MKIKRYDTMSNSHDSWFVERENGDYCRYSDYQKLESEKAELIKALEWFCNRVDAGEVRSKRTYARFRELLNKFKEK